MRALAAIAGVVLLVSVLWEAFETIILPRRVTRRLRLTRLYYRSIWKPWCQIALHTRSGKRREAVLSIFGPLSLLLLFGLWAVGLIFAFALLHWASGSNVRIADQGPSFWTDLYMSGSAFFTLGLGDVTPRTALARAITVIESGLGLGFLAGVIAYLPVLYGAFSQREVNISLLDARAGSPPTAAELLRRHSTQRCLDSATQYLRDWEPWAAQLLESHLSYPVLCYFRSQHDNQSWLGALTTILDSCAILMTHAEGDLRWQAHLTFAISRHAVVDISQVLRAAPRQPQADRLPPADLARLRTLLGECGAGRWPNDAEQKLNDLRRMYEPYVTALSGRLMMPLPEWIVSAGHADNWRTSAWARSFADAGVAPLSDKIEDEHF